MANFVLDILLSWDTDGSISTSVYLQATHTDQYLDFQSHHSVAHKWHGQSSGLWMCRAKGFSSLAVSHVEARGKARGGGPAEEWVPQGVYPEADFCLRADRASLQDSETRATLTLPYISGLSESTRRILSPLSIQILFHP